MRRARILSTGSCLPGEPLTNQDLERIVGPLPPPVLEGIQVERRYWIADPTTGEQRQSNSDLAAQAVKEALDLAGLTPDDLDLLVLSTSSGDYVLPPMVTLVQDKLGLARCATLQVHSGCAGWVEALDVARLYLESGAYETAAVVGSETISPLLVPMFRGQAPDSIRMRDRVVLYEFGDGAGAAILQATDEAPGILGSALACMGGGRKPGVQIVGGGTHAPIHEQLAAPRFVSFKVDVVEAGRFTPHVLVAGLVDVLERSGVGAGAIDVCLIPEGNAGYMTAQLREAGLLTPEWVAIEPKIVENLSAVGATGSASVPLALDHAWKTGRVRPGDHVMLLAVETTKWIYAGMVLVWSAPTPSPSGSKPTGQPRPW